MTTLNGPELPPASGGKPDNLVILLHGLGSNGEDLLHLAIERFSKSLPNTYFISPNAPISLEPMFTIYGYMEGYQWFDWLPDNKPAMLEGAKKSAVILNDFIDEQLKKHSLEPKNLALVGFSQGTVMSLLVGLNRPESIAGIVGYSGAILNDEITCKTDICLVHGMADDVVPFAAMELAEEFFKQNNINAETHAIEGLAHGIDEKAIQIGEDFLKKTLAE